MFAVNDKVYFGRGPMEFVGIVQAVAPDTVTLSGVELGFLATQRVTVDVPCPGNKYRAGIEPKIPSNRLRLLDVDEFDQLTRDEPAFADLMPQERFCLLHDELKHLELLLQVRNRNATDPALVSPKPVPEASRRLELREFRMRELGMLIASAPWELLPDGTCRAKASAPSKTGSPEYTVGLWG